MHTALRRGGQSLMQVLGQDMTKLQLLCKMKVNIYVEMLIIKYQIVCNKMGLAGIKCEYVRVALAKS